MQVKVCPKCKAQNRPTSAACSNCYSSLESVPVTEGTAPPVAAAAAPAAPRPPRPTPAPTQQMAPPQQTQQMGVPGQTQMGAMPPPPPQRLPPGAYQVPPKQKSTAGIIVLVLFLVCAALGAMVFAVSKSGLFKGAPKPTESPDKAVLAFLEAKKTEDLAKCEPYLSEHSVNMVRNALSSQQAKSAGFTRKDAEDMLLWGVAPTKEDMRDKEITATNLKGDRDADETTAIVEVVVDNKPAPAPAPQMPLAPGQEPPTPPVKRMTFGSMRFGRVEVQYVLVAEQGKWKVDLDNTNRRVLGLGPRQSIFKIGK